MDKNSQPRTFPPFSKQNSYWAQKEQALAEHLKLHYPHSFIPLLLFENEEAASNKLVVT